MTRDYKQPQFLTTFDNNKFICILFFLYLVKRNITQQERKKNVLFIIYWSNNHELTITAFITRNKFLTSNPYIQK